MGYLLSGVAVLHPESADKSFMKLFLSNSLSHLFTSSNISLMHKKTNFDSFRIVVVFFLASYYNSDTETYQCLLWSDQDQIQQQILKKLLVFFFFWSLHVIFSHFLFFLICFSLFFVGLFVWSLIKTFQLPRLTCPDFLTCILSLWKNCAPLTSVSSFVSDFFSPFFSHNCFALGGFFSLFSQ